MPNIHETFHVYLYKVALIEVIHDGLKYFDDQKEGTYQELINYLRSEIEMGNTKGWTPYANFESSFRWKIIDEDIVFHIDS